MTNRKRYTREFKLEAVRLLETSDKPITDIARQQVINSTSGRSLNCEDKNHYHRRHSSVHQVPHPVSHADAATVRV